MTEETALETAKKVDEKVAKGEELPLLAGVPLALKDNMNLVGSKTTASSKILENFVSKLEDVCVVEKAAKQEGRNMTMVLAPKKA